MKELRRLLIDHRRIKESGRFDSFITLKNNEIHYLNRVLRLRKGDSLNVIDGAGHLWTAIMNHPNSLQLTTTVDNPLISVPSQQAKICLAVVVPKQGFDEVLRMGCEIGVDVFQPLTSQYQVFKADNESRSKRWNTILKESVEQCERLWIPELLAIRDVQDWMNNKPESAVAIATTRIKESIEIQLWTNNLGEEINGTWILIGPEGGWSKEELGLARRTGCISVSFGEYILRTSTAAISASQLLVAWRRMKFLA